MHEPHPIKAYREAQDPPLTQKQLAKRLGLKYRETIARWEAGTRKIDTDKLAKITKVTGIPARELRPDLADLMEPA